MAEGVQTEREMREGGRRERRLRRDGKIRGEREAAEEGGEVGSRGRDERKVNIAALVSSSELLFINFSPSMH